MIVKDFDDYREARHISLRAVSTARKAAVASICEARELLEVCHDYVVAKKTLQVALARIDEAMDAEEFLVNIDYRETCGQTMEERWNETE